VLLSNSALTILLLRETDAGRTHDKRMADATPDPLPAGSRWLQDRGFLAFTLEQVESIMPTRKPRGRALTRAQQAANRASPRAHCACHQPCQALPYHPRHRPSAEGGPSRCSDGSLLGVASLPRAFDTMATDGLIGMNSNATAPACGSISLDP
jgi:hypothetical protein